ncbi:daf-6 [Cordylochernes scorpioides]|uniref:Daf-6 n=1 Tax=Cordylochernes scorpioides TaxID=51811 RepID=A0ABY6KJP5_9ARAC|nr:daf-6 [Cordylochernes scorpioides]
MGAIAGNGICLLAGLSFTPLNFSIPFLLIVELRCKGHPIAELKCPLERGVLLTESVKIVKMVLQRSNKDCVCPAIGIDDTFIFLAAWRSTDPKESVEKRLALTYERSAVSVTLTSVTNCASFLACTSMPTLATRIFGIYAINFCLLVYIYQLTFMGGIMALTGRLEAAGYHGMLPCVRVKDETDSPSWFGNVLCLYKNNKEKIMEENHLQNAGVIFFQDYYGKLLTKKSVKALILTHFLLHIAISIYGFTKIRISMKFTDTYPYDSYAIEFDNLISKSFTHYNGKLQFIIEEPVDYSKKDVQTEILNLIKEIQETPYVASEPILNEFWLTYYLDFINQSQGSFIMRNYNTSSKYGFIDYLRSKFFKIKQFQIYENDVYFNENYTEILSSRFVIQMIKASNPDFLYEGMKWIKNRLDKFNYKISIYNPRLIFLDSLTEIMYTLFTTISSTIVAMLVLTLILMPDIVIGLSVTLSLIVIELGILGYMDFWGLYLNDLSLFGITLFIGLSVDSTAHILHAFMSSKKSNLDDRMRDALGKVGMPIVQGFLSSAVGMAALSFLPSYAYLVLYKTGMMLLIFSLVNSLTIIPVLLSLISRNKKIENKTKEEKDVKIPSNQI